MPLYDVALCYGTRPQVIKASVLRTMLAPRARVLAVDTGQHYDYALNALLYSQLGVLPPDHFLEVRSASHGRQTGDILTLAEEVLAQARPRVVIVIGDTNSTLGGALAAAKLRIPVVHVEAGLRAEDRLMAEEINRRAVDAVATVLCAPSAVATERLRRERPDATVVETGDVAYDVLLRQAGRLPPLSGVLPDGINGEYVFATLHRAELTDHPDLLRSAVAGLAQLPWPVVFAAHPRTRQALESLDDNPALSDRIRMLPAVGYLESLALASGARAVITDSGGLQREAYWLGVPCLTLRRETEWAETVDCGANLLVPPATAHSGLAEAAARQVSRWNGHAGWDRRAYGDGHAAERIVQAIAPLL